MLSIKNITKKIGSKLILNNVSLEVPNNSIALLVGESGVGKSTLLRVLNNLESYDSGTILFNGKVLDLTKVSKDHTVGMIFQGFNLFEHMTIAENISFPLEKIANKNPRDAHQTALNLLKEYQLLDKAHHYPSQLSGGQKQRLAIARTIALQPKIICMDEPTSALDPLLTNYVAQSIQELASQGYTILVASHDTTLLEALDCTVYLMQQGSIVESAPTKRLLQSPESYPKLSRFIKGKAY